MQENRLGIKLFTLAIGLVITLASVAQGTVKGFVSSKETGEPVMFASVSLEGTNYGVSTDITGFYSLSKIPSGIYTIVVSSIEFENTKLEVEIINGKVLTKNFLLESSC